MWDISSFGKDRDLFDKDGVQIYGYEGDVLMHRDLDLNTGEWLNTTHVENENTTHPLAYKLKENYYEKL